jgi:hypothetical protein
LRTALKKIFGPRRVEVTGDWKKMHNEELQNLYSSPSIIRIMKSRRIDKACNTNGGKDGKRPLGSPRHRWVDNIEIDLREIGWGGME